MKKTKKDSPKFVHLNFKMYFRFRYMYGRWDFGVKDKIIGLVDKYSFPLIAISAIAKQNADSLSLFSASETSRIAYSGVSVLGLESKEGNDASYTTVNVKVLKNRYGQKPTDITLSFDGRYSRFFEFKPVKSTKGKKAAG